MSRCTEPLFAAERGGRFRMETGLVVCNSEHALKTLPWALVNDRIDAAYLLQRWLEAGPMLVRVVRRMVEVQGYYAIVPYRVYDRSAVPADRQYRQWRRQGVWHE